MTSEFPKLSGTVLNIATTLQDQVLVARFTGTADVEAKPQLDQFMKELQTAVETQGAKKVVVDFRELEFMNSSSFKVFVTWLGALQDKPADQQYRIHFLSNPNIHWQRRSLAALSCFAVDLISIET